jgi:hypothetical protein
VFLGIALAASAAVAGVLAREGNAFGALVAAAATVYFALRLFAGLGKGTR